MFTHKERMIVKRIFVTIGVILGFISFGFMVRFVYSCIVDRIQINLLIMSVALLIISTILSIIEKNINCVYAKQALKIVLTMFQFGSVGYGIIYTYFCLMSDNIRPFVISLLSGLLAIYCAIYQACIRINDKKEKENESNG